MTTAPPRQLLVLDADVRTGDPACPRAAALAVEGGRVVLVGDVAAARARLAPGASALSFGGRVITPGLHDAHTHLGAWARARARLSLAGADSVEEVLARVRARHAALPVGAWLWGEELTPFSAWPAPPHGALLDAAAPGRAVLLWTRDRHACLVSGAALEAAGVAVGAPDPPAGAFGRDATGALTGWLFESAGSLVAGTGSAEPDAPLAPVLRDLARFGITCVHDFGGAADYASLRTARDAGELTVRVAFGFMRAGLPGATDAAAVADAVRQARGAADDLLWPWALKAFADGSLGARTANVLAPYAGGTDTGLATLDANALDALSAEARGLGLTLAVHAIGDAAVRSALDAFARWDPPARAELRPRVEHAQLVAAADMPRFAALGVVASMQPVHAASDRALATRLWGARDAAGGYAWRQLADAGARLAFGSDVPIEPADPRLGIHAALTGGDAPAHARGETPARALTIERALAAFTGGAAWAIGRADTLGRLAPGARADFVVWERDPYAVAPAEWPGLGIAETWLAGERVHPRPAV